MTLNEHIHNAIATLFGIATSVFAPLPDLASQIFVGFCTGALIWIFTKSVTWLLKRFQ